MFRSIRKVFVCGGFSLATLLVSERLSDSSDARRILTRQFKFQKVLCESNVKENNQPGSIEFRNQYNFLAKIVKKVSPAVCSIRANLFNTHFGIQLGVSVGSGFFISPNGLLLTNAHVVQSESAGVTVELYDGTELKGRTIAYNATTDIALVKVDAKNVPFIPLGNSESMEAGEMVVALGSPFNITNTVTSGIISNSGKKLGAMSKLDPEIKYIMSDALITFGNSGGPLVNLDGEAIGINTLKFTNRSDSIGAAIPSNYVKEFVKESMKSSSTPSIFHKGSSKKYIGTRVIGLTPSLIHDLMNSDPYFPRNVSHGLWVDSVSPKSPAKSAGLEPNDIILSVNGQDAVATFILTDAVETSQSIQLKVLRNTDQILNITVHPKVFE